MMLLLYFCLILLVQVWHLTVGRFLGKYNHQPNVRAWAYFSHLDPCLSAKPRIAVKDKIYLWNKKVNFETTSWVLNSPQSDPGKFINSAKTWFSLSKSEIFPLTSIAFSSTPEGSASKTTLLTNLLSSFSLSIQDFLHGKMQATGAEWQKRNTEGNNIWKKSLLEHSDVAAVTRMRQQQLLHSYWTRLNNTKSWSTQHSASSKTLVQGKWS